MEWILNIENGEYLRSILPRPGVTYQEKHCVLLIVVISKNHVTTVSHCCACVDHAYKNCVDVAKTNKCQYKTKNIVKQHHQNSRLIQNAFIGSNDFSFQFRKIITRYRRIGYNLNVMRQSACLVFNPITVDNYAAFFNCTPVGRASDSMMAPT